MGYSRQGVAAGLIMLGMLSLRNSRPIQYCILIAIAAGFHSSAFSALPAVLFVSSANENRTVQVILKALILGVGLVGFYNLFGERYDLYVDHYYESGRYSSGGAFLRSSVTFFASLVFFVSLPRWRILYGDQVSLGFFASIGLLLLPFANIASTPVDRMGLYLLPFQIIVFARLPWIQGDRDKSEQVRLIIVVCYLVYFYVWLHHGAHSQDLWVPYRSALSSWSL
jgi:NADH:ubiquinone oxidoreductase subunit 3 (subunit A)